MRDNAMEKKQENKGLIPDIPILRASDQSYETSWSIKYLLEDMSIGTVPIPEERAGDYGSVSEWRGCIEIHVIKHSIDQEFHRFEIGIRHVPKGAPFKYMTDPSAREADSLWINPIDIDMQRDIAKDERAQLIAFIYYAQKKRAEEPRLFEDMKARARELWVWARKKGQFWPLKPFPEPQVDAPAGAREEMYPGHSCHSPCRTSLRGKTQTLLLSLLLGPHCSQSQKFSRARSFDSTTGMRLKGFNIS